MPILNYTTTIAAHRSAGEVQHMLARARAQSVTVEYDHDGNPSAMSFRLATPHGLLAFRLPARVDGVQAAMAKDRTIPGKLRNRPQAARVAWRILKDWIEAQLAIIDAELAEPAEVFMPYVLDGKGHSFFEAMKADGFKVLALPAPTKGGAR